MIRKRIGDVAEITNSTNGRNNVTATIRANKEGESIIRYGYFYQTHDDGKLVTKYKGEQFVIKVTNSSDKTGKFTRVYVYIKVQDKTGNAIPWTQNKDGWNTVGYIDVPASGDGGLLNASEATQNSIKDDTIIGNITKHTLVRFNGIEDKAFDLSKVIWKELNN